MANKYYYLTAQLPYLMFAEEPPITGERFLYECEKWLTESDMSLIRSIDIGDPGSVAFVDGPLAEYAEYEHGLRQALAETRRKKAASAPGRVKRVMDQPDPLKMEIELEKMKWEYIDDRAAGSFFDTDRLAFYYIQLQILERLAGFDKDTGERVFYKQCEVTYEK